MHGKGDKIRYVPLRPIAACVIADYLETADHADDKAAPLFRRVSNNARSVRAIRPDGVYRVLAKYADLVDIDIKGFGPRALRATAITNAFDTTPTWGGPGMGQARKHLDHVRYDRSQARPEDSPRFKVSY